MVRRAIRALMPCRRSRARQKRWSLSLARMELPGPAPGTSARTANGRDGIDHFLKERAVVLVRRRELRRQRDAGALDQKVALRARFAAVRRVRPGESAPLFAGTLALSSAARLQLITSFCAQPVEQFVMDALPYSSLLPLHSRSRRQQVMPLPQPISLGSRPQGIGEQVPKECRFAARREFR